MNNEFAGLYEVRDGNENDKNFILATFLRGVYHGDSWFSLIPKDVFMANYKKLAQSMIDNKRVVVKVACLPEDKDVILGYSILSQDYQAIVWVFVKKAWRNKGLGRALVPQYPTTVTHLTGLGKQLMTKVPTAVFNPFYPL